jgi:hypothetical protein
MEEPGLVEIIQVVIAKEGKIINRQGYFFHNNFSPPQKKYQAPPERKKLASAR